MWLFWSIVTLLSIKLYNKWTTGRCYSDNVMTGKVVVITGGNSGIGYETALELARRGAKVILGCRDDAKGQIAVDTIRNRTKNVSVKYIKLDLSSLASVREFVGELKKSEAKLDVLINNAGVSGVTQTRTADGIVRDMQINHFGPFLLTLLLVPLLKRTAPSRVICVSSDLHRFGSIDSVNDQCRNYMKLYCNSKLCNVLFSNELARRLEGTGVVVNSLNPGQVNTGLYRNTAVGKLRSILLYSFVKSPRDGAQTSLYLAISEECDQDSGKYFVDCRMITPSAKAADLEAAAKLWRLSEELVGLRPDDKYL